MVNYAHPFYGIGDALKQWVFFAFIRLRPDGDHVHARAIDRTNTQAKNELLQVSITMSSAVVARSWPLFNM